MVQHRLSSVSVQLYPTELLNFTTPRPSNLPHTIQPFISKLHPRLSPNKTPIVEQELLSTPERQIYQKYFYIETTPPSHTPQISRSAGPLKLTGSLGDLRSPKPAESKKRAHGTDAPKPVSPHQLVDVSETPKFVLVSSKPRIQIKLPAGPISHDRVIKLIKRSIEASSAALRTEMGRVNQQDYEKGYHKGIEAALHMCNCPLRNLTDWGIVESQPECSDFIKESLSRMAGRCTSPRQTPLETMESPRFLSAHQFVRKFKLGDRKRIIGRADGKEVVIALVGHVETHVIAEDDDGGFAGQCEMLLSGEAVPSMTGYCLGSIDGTGTALIVGRDDKLYVYSPEDAIDLPWEKLNAEGAEFVVDAQNIQLRSIPGMMAKSIEEG